jgi:hypothetical protein
VVVEAVEVVDGDGLVVVEDSVILFLSSLFLFPVLLFASLIPSIFRVDFLLPDSLDAFTLASSLSLILKLEYLIRDFIYYLLDNVNKNLLGQLELDLQPKTKIRILRGRFAFIFFLFCSRGYLSMDRINP